MNRCECKCGLNKNVFDWKQKWNHDECWCQCKGLNDWSPCKACCMWNPSTYDCECKKTCQTD